jgi:DnaJ-class molecular chaperone
VTPERLFGVAAGEPAVDGREATRHTTRHRPVWRMRTMDENHGLGVGIDCPHCDGEGETDGEVCETCGGDGIVTSYLDGTLERCDGV